MFSAYFFFKDTATTEIYTLALPDALPIWDVAGRLRRRKNVRTVDADQPRAMVNPRSRSGTAVHPSHGLADTAGQRPTSSDRGTAPYWKNDIAPPYQPKIGRAHV